MVKKPKAGDVVWYYDPEFTMCREGTVESFGVQGTIFVRPVTYTDDGKKHLETCEARSEAELWYSLEAAAEAVSKDFERDLLQNSISWYDEQQEFKALGEAKGLNKEEEADD